MSSWLNREQNKRTRNQLISFQRWSFLFSFSFVYIPWISRTTQTEPNHPLLVQIEWNRSHPPATSRHSYNWWNELFSLFVWVLRPSATATCTVATRWWCSAIWTGGGGGIRTNRRQKMKIWKLWAKLYSSLRKLSYHFHPYFSIFSDFSFYRELFSVILCFCAIYLGKLPNNFVKY